MNGERYCKKCGIMVGEIKTIETGENRFFPTKDFAGFKDVQYLCKKCENNGGV